MRKSLFIALTMAGLFLTSTASKSFAAEPKSSDSKSSDSKTVTISGEGKCAKCALKETDTCQNVIQTKEDGKTVTYYIVKNDVADSFHKNVCKGPKKVTAKGT